MSNPTTPFSWQMPTATDLVTDLPADFEVFGQAVATSMADLLGGASGYILSKASATDMDFTWIANDQGDITGITATTPLTGGGSSGAITVGIQDALTSQKGAVQLSDSTSTTSSILAATPTAVKSAFDTATTANTTANAAIPKSTVTTNGDLIYGTGSAAVTRLGIGSTSQVLTVAGGVPTWATPSTGGSLVKIGTTTTFTTSAAVNVDSCFSTTYDNYIIKLNINSSASSNALQLRFRTGGTTNTSSSYGNSWKYNAYGSAGASANLGSAVASNIIYLHDITSGASVTNMDVNNPFASFKTMITYNANQSNGYAATGAGQFDATTSFDGISIISAAGTITGTITVYGYTKG